MRTVISLLFLGVWLPWTVRAELHHDLQVSLELETNSIEVIDTLTLPEGHAGPLTFQLHPAMQIEVLSEHATLVELTPSAQRQSNRVAQSHTIIPRVYRASLAKGEHSFTIRYRGSIAHPLQSYGEEYARSFQQTRGMVAQQGVFLSGASLWYPQVDGELINFDLRVQLPKTWKTISQGESVETEKGSSEEHWRARTPQEEIYLIAGPFAAYSSVAQGVTAMVLLREADEPLAQKYLEHTHQYIALYNDLIGPYPFKKFAMVENFWETGYGMPSFTLLGSRVIRLPFILYSSYPHEILHNWWGNSVYIDYATGNWAEGLTSYLADHLIKEQRGSADAYRRDTLQKYADYVSKAEDFPLSDFRGRHSARTEAVGYGKTLMLFHMLRLMVGDDLFKQGLQQLYRQQRFKLTSFEDVEASFAAVTDQPVDGFFQQWVQRSGAPELRVRRAEVEADGDRYRLTAMIEQIQEGPAYDLNVPLAVHLDGVDQAYQTTVKLSEKKNTITLDLAEPPLRLDVDPEFDVFRRLHRNEIPPAISQAMGAEDVTIVLPAESSADKLEAYRVLAARWQQARPGQVAVVNDDELQSLPADTAVWLFGWDNRFKDSMSDALKDYDFGTTGDGVMIAGTELSVRSHSMVVLGRQAEQADLAIGWLAADSAAAISGLGRKLPHYGRYSYLGFSGTAPDNVLKGQWPVVASPLTVFIDQRDSDKVGPASASLAPRPALAATAERFSVERMRSDIEYLADRRMAGRGIGSAELDLAADYIAQQFRAIGLEPAGDNGSFFQVWEQPVAGLGRSVAMRNVIAKLPGQDAQLDGQSLVIGAHYDHLGLGELSERKAARGSIHPGADDNASGVAVMLEIARGLAAKPLPRSVIFVAFTGEETGLLGSRHFIATRPSSGADSIFAMLNVDTVGRLNNRPLTLFGAGTADEWAHIFRGVGYVTGVAVKPVAAEFGSSDQAAFIEAGVPAVQFFGGHHPDFHGPGDTPEKIDYAGLNKAAKVLDETVRYLGARSAPLQSTLSERVPEQTPQGSTRRVSFGTVPDFAYTGDGVRLDDVREDTPAGRAGLRRGDIITAVNAVPVNGLREYSDALKKLAPGDEIQVRYQRDGVEKSLKTRVTER